MEHTYLLIAKYVLYIQGMHKIVLRVLCAIIVLIGISPAARFAHAASDSYDELEQLGWKIINETAIPNVQIRTADNQKVRARALADNNRLTLLNFWATWCAPCVAELPMLMTLNTQFAGDNFAVRLINTQEDAEVVNNFLTKLQITLPSFRDSKGKLAKRMGIRGMPVSFLVNGDGEIFARYIGLFNWENAQFQRLMRSMLSDV